MRQEPHVILGVSPDASPEEIRRRFRFLSHAFHPDKFPDERQRANAEEEFKRMKAAHDELLSDGARDAGRETENSERKEPKVVYVKGKEFSKQWWIEGFRQVGGIALVIAMLAILGGAFEMCASRKNPAAGAKESLLPGKPGTITVMKKDASGKVTYGVIPEENELAAAEKGWKKVPSNSP